MTFKPTIFVLTITFLTALTFSSRLFADAVPDANAVSQLIAQLGDDDCMVRNNAQEILSGFGNSVKAELEKALTSTQDPEVYQRLQFILQSIPVVWDEPGDEPELAKFIQQYRRASCLSRMFVMEELRRLPIEIQIKALDRIIQKEQNNGTALFAAMALWYWRPETDSPQYEQITRFINDAWKGSRSPAINNLYYLVNYKKLRAEATIWFDNQLQSAVDLNRIPSKSAELIPEYVGTILAEFARREAESLIPIDELPDKKRMKFPVPKFGTSMPTVIVNGVVQKQFYIRGQVLVALSNSNMAGAQTLSTASVIPLLGPIYLSHRGMSNDADAWLNWEFSNARNVSVLLHRSIAETLHEYGLNKAAVTFLESTIKDNNSANNEQIRILSTDDKGRLEYFRACQAKQENKPDKQWEFLLESLKADKEELDSLIMQWELCQLPAEENKIAAITDEVRKQVDESIEKLLSELNEEIINSGTDSYTQLNKYAWLAVKTNRHLDNALKYSKEAVEINPTSSACIDTLAHCYAANGDLDKAVEFQSQAVELDPISQVLYKNLLHFKELKEKEKQDKKE